VSQTITLRVPDSVADWLKSWARRSSRSVNDIGAMLLEEAKRVSEFAHIEFRTIVGERHACLKGMLPVWQVIKVARNLDMDPVKLAEYFDWPLWRAEAAFNYYTAFPAEIDVAIDECLSVGYEGLKRMFPHMRLVEVDISDPDEVTNNESADRAAESRAYYDASASKDGVL
jgi:hypothetical protein